MIIFAVSSLQNFRPKDSFGATSQAIAPTQCVGEESPDSAEQCTG